MQPLPHHYTVTASTGAGPEIDLVTGRVPALTTAAPPEFDGPEGLWSPETLLVGAAADCFAITFRGVARASRLAWHDLSCDVTGTLDRVDGVMRFTRMDLRVHLVVADDDDEARALRVLEMTKRNCLITNSLTAHVELHAAIEPRTIRADGCQA